MTDRKTGFLWHELFAWHETGNYPTSATSPVEPHPLSDTPATKRRFRNLLDVSGLLAALVDLPIDQAGDDAILRVHSRAHLETLLTASANGGGSVGPYARMEPDGMRIVRMASGGAMAAVDAVIGGVVDNAYALVRPAGHHATADQAMGYCLVNNTAVAARHAQAVHGLGRIAIVDWDVHHGNGTEAIFFEDPSVLTISLHQDGLYPVNSGAAGDVGSGRGRGANINIPLPAGSGHGAYIAALDRIVLPALSSFKPDLIIVGSGFDALQNDPLGRMMLTSASFRQMTARIMDAAETLCAGRTVFCHEGGYAAVHVPFAGLAVCEQLAGRSTPVVDPFLPGSMERPGQELLPHQDSMLTQLERHVLPLVASV